jgi:pimeloyl-ACP methyl ester carboxylesterase
MPIFERGDIRIHYREQGTGFPLLIIPGGGLNAVMSYGAEKAPFDAFAEFADEFRCITFDLRNAQGGESSGPLEVDRPWDSHTDDQLALLDHLGVERFAVLGYCIGGPFAWNLLRRAPARVVAAVMAQPSGFRPEQPDLFYQSNITGWGPQLLARRPEVTMAQVEAFLARMYRDRADFVFTVTRDFVRACPTPVLVLPDDIPAHPYAVAVESAMLAPNSQLSLYPWKDRPERVPLAVRHIRGFLRASLPR